MSITIFGVVCSALIFWFSYLYLRSIILRKKLWWVEKASGYPLVGNIWDFADSTKSLNAMHKYVTKHNGVCFTELLFRPIILISDYKFVEWQLSSNNILLKKSKDYQFLYNWLEGGLLISDGAEWKTSRKILVPAFHFSILEQFVEVFNEPTSVLIKLLGKEVDKESTDISQYITNYTLDVICQTSMGVQMNIQESSHTDYIRAVNGMCKIVVERAFNPLKMINIFYHLSMDYQKEKEYVKLLHEVSNKVINTRRLEIEEENEHVEEDNGVGTKRKMAFLDLLLKYRDANGQPLSHSFIRHEVDTFMFAGHDTTAAAISFAMYCLAHHPDIQAQALAEIREVLEKQDEITYKDLLKLKYVELVVKETLRLYPSVPIYSRQTTEDIIYKDDQIIPKGITLLIVAYTINRDPKVYDQPNEFIPTRFLDSNIKPFSYVPFSAGPRNCIGQKFAMLEMKYALAKILLNYELVPATPEHKIVLAAETVLKSKSGIKIALKKRLIT